MISIKNIPLNTTVAFFYIEDENKVTFSEQVTLIEYDDVYSEYSCDDDDNSTIKSIESNETIKEKFTKKSEKFIRFLKSFNLKLKIIKR